MWSLRRKLFPLTKRVSGKNGEEMLKTLPPDYSQDRQSGEIQTEERMPHGNNNLYPYVT